MSVEAPGSRVSVLVDRDRCFGSGECTLVAPEIFALDSDGLVNLLKPLPGSESYDLLFTAASGCPSGAIIVLKGTAEPGDESSG